MSNELEQVLNFTVGEIARIDAITDAMVIRPRTITIHIDDARVLVEAAERANLAEERLAAALGADKPEKPATPTERARHWAMEACDQKRRAEAAEAALAANADELKRLMVDTDVVLSELNPQEVKGAIN